MTYADHEDERKRLIEMLYESARTGQNKQIRLDIGFDVTNYRHLDFRILSSGKGPVQTSVEQVSSTTYLLTGEIEIEGVARRFCVDVTAIYNNEHFINGVRRYVSR